MQIKTGSTDKSVRIRIVDSTDGTPETGVTSATSGLSLSYHRDGAAVVSITPTDLTALTDAHTDGGLKHIGAGYYRLDLPDAALATGVDGVLVFGTVTGMVVIGQEIQLIGYNPRTELTTAVLALIDVAISSRIAPTTAGRTLDVSAGGAAGVDWSNVESPTTTLNLSGTTIKDVTDPVDAVAATTVITLSQVRAIMPEQVDTGDISLMRGDSMSLQLTGMGALTGYTSLWFTVKRETRLEDSEALIQIKKNASGLNDGLIYINGESASDASKGSITIDDASDGDITIALDDTVSKTLPPGEYHYDVQMLNSGTVTTLTAARFVVAADVTRAVA